MPPAAPPGAAKRGTDPDERTDRARPDQPPDLPARQPPAPALPPVPPDRWNMQPLGAVTRAYLIDAEHYGQAAQRARAMLELAYGRPVPEATVVPNDSAVSHGRWCVHITIPADPGRAQFAF